MRENIQQFTAGLEAINWQHMASQLGENGFSLTQRMLQPQACQKLSQLYGHGQRFRSTINMDLANISILITL